MTYDGNSAAPTNAGSYEVIATIDEDLYLGSVTGTLEVAQADPGVTSWPTATGIVLGQTLADSTLQDGAATELGAFAFADSAHEPPAGTNDVWVLYNPTDAINYLVASNEVEIVVSEDVSDVFLSNLAQTYDGTAREVTVTTDPPDLPYEITYDGNSWAPTNVGSYAVEVALSPPNVGSTNGTLVVSKGTPTVTVAPSASSIAVGQSVGSAALSGGTVVVGPTTVTGTFSFNDPSFTPPETGTYQVNVNFTPDDTDNLVSPIAAGQVTLTVQELLYSESFEYGDTATGINDVSNWSASSANLKYDPAGLTHPVMNDEQGGSMWLDDTSARSATDSRPNVDLGALEVGEVLWYAVLIEHHHSSGTASLLFQSDSNVGDIYIRLLSDGQAQLNLSKTGYISGNTNADRDTGVYAADGEASLLLLKVTKGSPKDSPTNTGFAFWLNPSKALQESDLGTPDWTASDGLFGRDPGTWGSVVATPSNGGRIDEIRVGTSLTEVLPFIFEPSIFRFR